MLIVHGKNDFAAVSKNLVRYRSENNFIRSLNIYVSSSCWLLKC